jgi:hypothetical protein
MIKFILVLLITISSAYAEDCKTESSDKLSDFFLDFVYKSSSLNKQLIQYDKVTKGKESSLTDIMVEVKKLKSSYDCFADLIGSYKASNVKEISESSTKIEQALRNLSKTLQESIESIKNYESLEKLTEGQKADRDSDRIIANEKQWVDITSGLMHLFSFSSEILDPKTKKSVKVFMSKKDKENVLKFLNDEFKFPIKDLDKVYNPEALSYLIYKTLKDCVKMCPADSK